MEFTIQKLKKLITPSLSGIVWLSEKPLDEKPVPFVELNYFFNGLISSSKNQPGGNLSKQMFIGESFGKSLSLIFMDTSKCSKEDITNSLSVFPKKKQSILVIGKKSFPQKEASKKYPDLSYLYYDVN